MQIIYNNGRWTTVCNSIAPNVKSYDLRIHFGRDELDFSNIRINGSNLEIVNHVKIVGLTISNDLKWNQHVNNIVKKTNNRIYFIIQRKRAKITPSEILLFYCTCVRPTLEYSTQVFQYALPNDPSDVVELAQQKRVLSIIYPAIYKPSSLDERRPCLKLFKSIESSPDHKLHNLLPTRMVQHHCLRNHREFMIPNVNTNRFLN